MKHIYLLNFTSLICLFFAGCRASQPEVSATASVNYSGTDRNPDSVLVASGPHYDRSAFHSFLWGKHYRDIWAVPVKAPVFDIKTEKGGLKPLKQGGSFQTKNLRLEDSAGNEYVLRSIDKDPTKALPDFLQKTFIANWMRDQTSVIHPYGAFIVPPLANAAGVFHTNPKLVFIPNDPLLGEFQESFANTLALFEERPDGKQKHMDSFGNPEEVVSSRKAFHKVINNSCHLFDHRQYLRSRLFDMWIGDWSRREDQWRWGIFENETNEFLYKPIPRDRDHAFFKFKDGLITALIGIFRPTYQTFSKQYGNVKGLNRSARPMDDVLLAGIGKEEFLQIATDLQNRLTDDVIKNALHQWPDTIYKLSHDQFYEKLRLRRDKLPMLAEKYYKILAKEVLITGTDDRETFQVERLNNDEVRIRILRKPGKCNGAEFISDRTFNRKETKVILLYGLGEEDEFKFLNSGVFPIDIEVYPGEGEDLISGEENTNLKNVTVFLPGDGDVYENLNGAKLKNYDPKAEDYTAEGWLLRHRLE